jgi:hypothetical protein
MREVNFKRFLIVLAIASVAAVSAVGQTKITTAEELMAVGKDATSLRGRYTLENDLTVENWTPIGTIASPFLGFFDGQGHTVTIVSTGDIPTVPNKMRSGVTIPQIETTAVGIFGMTGRRSVVQNLKVAGSIAVKLSQSGNLIVGGIAGLSYGVIQECASDVTIEAGAGAGEGFCIAGGIAGVNNSTLRHCYSAGDISSKAGKNSYAGGIVGVNDFDAGVIQFCFAAGNISSGGAASKSYAGGVAGICARGGVMDFCAATNGSVTAEGAGEASLTGRIVGENLGRIGRSVFSRRDMTLTDDKTPADNYQLHEYSSMKQQEWWTPQGRIAGFPFGSNGRAPWAWNAEQSRPALYWEQGVTVTAATSRRERRNAAARAVAEPPIEIHTVEELTALDDALALRKNYILMNDLTVENWTPIGKNRNQYTGTFDGNGYTITILGFNNQADSVVARNINARISVGLFSINKGTIKNLRVKGDLSYDSGVGDLFIGAVAGRNYGKIINCVSEANIQARGGKYTKGRGFGYMMLGGMTNSIVTELDGAFGGGIVGLNSGSVINCYATGDIAVSGEGFKGSGGIVGRNSIDDNGGEIANCYATGTISAREDNATRFAGGVVGLNYSEGLVQNCVALNPKIEAVGKQKGMMITGAGFGGFSNFALGTVGCTYSVGTGVNYHKATSKNTFYPDQMVIIAEKDEEAEAEAKDKNEDSKGILAMQAERGDRVEMSVMQEETWWQEMPQFQFGADETNPWVWDDALKRPVLYWETDTFTRNMDSGGRQEEMKERRLDNGNV